MTPAFTDLPLLKIFGHRAKPVLLQEFQNSLILVMPLSWIHHHGIQIYSSLQYMQHLNQEIFLWRHTSAAL